MIGVKVWIYKGEVLEGRAAAAIRCGTKASRAAAAAKSAIGDRDRERRSPAARQAPAPAGPVDAGRAGRSAETGDFAADSAARSGYAPSWKQEVRGEAEPPPSRREPGRGEEGIERVGKLLEFRRLSLC